MVEHWSEEPGVMRSSRILDTICWRSSIDRAFPWYGKGSKFETYRQLHKLVSSNGKTLVLYSKNAVSTTATSSMSTQSSLHVA